MNHSGITPSLHAHAALDALRFRLRRRKLDALLVAQPENRRYLSGYTATDNTIAETSGLLLIPAAGPPHLLTDFRYQLQAEAEAKGFEVLLYPRGLQALLQKILPKLAVRRLAFESHYTLHSTVGKLMKMATKMGVEFLPETGLVEDLRAAKGAWEVEKIARSVDLNEKVFQAVFGTLVPGQTEREVARRIEETMGAMGADGPSFETIVAAGENGAMPHAVPGERVIRAGEPIIIDMGVKLDGYCSDMTRTVVLGTPSERFIELHRIVRQAQLAGIAAMRAGAKARAVDAAARDLIRAAGYGERFGHSLGHGVGLAIHEAPRLSSRSRETLAAGMVVTVEPGIYLPGWGGIRLENMVVVEEGGCRLLSRDTTMLNVCR